MCEKKSQMDDSENLRIWRNINKPFRRFQGNIYKANGFGFNLQTKYILSFEREGKKEEILKEMETIDGVRLTSWIILFECLSFCFSGSFGFSLSQFREHQLEESASRRLLSEIIKKMEA